MYENYSVLFVDDEVNILSSLKRGLMDEGFTSYFASSGKEALEILGKQKMSVIVSDMRMPEMDGLKLLKEVETRYPHMIKIILSGYTQLPQILTTINQVDIFKFITKPWKLEDEFIVAIHKALDYYILQEENENNKKALQNKNQAYINILKSVEDTIASARKSCDILGECGRQLFWFSRHSSGQSKEINDIVLDLQVKIFDLFDQAVKGEEKETSSETLFNDVKLGIEAYMPIAKMDVKPGYAQKIKIYHKIALAILLSCAFLLEDIYKQNGLYLVAATNNTGAPTISLICPKGSQETQNQEALLLLDIKVDLLNSVIASVAKMSGMEFCTTQMNGNIIAVLTFTISAPNNNMH